MRVLDRKGRKTVENGDGRLFENELAGGPGAQCACIEKTRKGSLPFPDPTDN